MTYAISLSNGCCQMGMKPTKLITASRCNSKNNFKKCKNEKLWKEIRKKLGISTSSNFREMKLKV